MIPENMNLHIRCIKELHDLLSVTGNGFSHVSPDDTLMMQDDITKTELPVSLYNIMFTPLGSVVKSQYEHELDQN